MRSYSLDRHDRNNAVTIRGSIYGHCYNDLSGSDIKNGAIGNSRGSTLLYFGESDTISLTGAKFDNGEIEPNPKQQNIVRMLQPHNGELTEFWLDLDIVVNTTIDSDLTLKVAVGQFGVAPRPLVNTWPDEYIDASWAKIYGTYDPLVVSNGHIKAENLNIFPALLGYDDIGWDQDFVMLLLHFNKQPTFDIDHRLFRFNCHQATVGVL